MKMKSYGTLRNLSGERPSRSFGLAIAVSALIAVLALASNVLAAYAATNLVSDIPGSAKRTDRNLVNCWGIAVGSSGTSWVANNGTGKSTLYDQNGVPQSLVVTVPPSATNTEGANPTRIVYNAGYCCVVSEVGFSGAAVFIFVSDDVVLSVCGIPVATVHVSMPVVACEAGAVSS